MGNPISVQKPMEKLSDFAVSYADKLQAIIDKHVEYSSSLAHYKLKAESSVATFKSALTYMAEKKTTILNYVSKALDELDDSQSNEKLKTYAELVENNVEEYNKKYSETVDVLQSNMDGLAELKKILTSFLQSEIALIIGIVLGVFASIASMLITAGCVVALAIHLIPAIPITLGASHIVLAIIGVIFCGLIGIAIGAAVFYLFIDYMRTKRSQFQIAKEEINYVQSFVLHHEESKNYIDMMKVGLLKLEVHEKYALKIKLEDIKDQLAKFEEKVKHFNQSLVPPPISIENTKSSKSFTEA